MSPVNDDDKETTMFSPTKTRIRPTEIAPDTFVIHNHHGEGVAPVSVALNTMLIRGSEPVVVDTGMAENSEEYFEDLFSLVEPEDVRWIYISHDDVDHTGALNELAMRAPNATVIVNWFMGERMGASLAVPPHRQRWIGDGERFWVGDRELYAVRPPVFDSPTTRGLYDPTTGVYWASASFASPMLVPTNDVHDVDPEFWAGGVATFAQYVSPWLELVDQARFEATVDRIQVLGPTVIAGCHTPPITGERVAQVFDLTRSAPTAEVPPLPDQAVLDEIIAALGVPA